MRTALKVILALLIVAGFVGVGASRAMLMRSRESLHFGQEALLADWLKYERRIAADEARWKDDALVAPHDGPDAAALIFAHVRWEQSTAPSPIPRSVMDKFGTFETRWAEHVEELGLGEVDTSWVSQLGSYGYWDVESEGSELKGKPFEPVTESIPNFIDALGLGKVHLAQGLLKGDARPAARDVRELARLCISTEALIGEMVGVSLMGIERHVYDEAVRRGHDVTGWAPLSAPEVDSLKRVFWAALPPHALLATATVAAARPAVGECVGLHEGLNFAHYLRGYAETELPERYTAITQALERDTGCRLKRARAAWQSGAKEGQLPVNGKALCAAQSDADATACRVPDFVTSFPYVRPFIGVTLATLAAPDSFKGYRDNP